MTLDDIYTQLSYGELRQLFLSGRTIDDSEAKLTKAQHAKLLPSVQLGLTELHKRMFLREAELQVELQTGQVVYALTPKYAESNNASKEPIKYIKDATSKFQNNLLKIERVYGTWNEEEYAIPLNIQGDPTAVRTTSYNVLTVPTDEEKAPWLTETTHLRVVFRADHPEIPAQLANISPRSVEIYLPPTHIEALCFYIASRQHNPLGMVPGAMHEGNNYFQRFEASIQELKNLSMEIDDDVYETAFWDKGFC